MKARLFFPVALACLSFPLHAQLKVSIEAPTLKPGMGSLQSALDDQAQQFSVSLGEILEASLEKPALMRGFTRAAGTSSLLPATIPPQEGIDIECGSVAAAWSEEWSAQALQELKAMEASEDPAFGLSVEPFFLEFSLPLSLVSRRLPPGMYAGASLGWMKAQGSSYGLSSFSAGARVGGSLLRGPDGPLRFEGLRVEGGLEYASNLLSALVSPGPIYQTIPVDPDGNGPLAPINATISVDPSVPVSVRTDFLGGEAQVSGGMSLYRFLSLSLGGGILLSLGNSAFSLSSSVPVKVEGYLSTLVEKDGSVTVSGTAGRVSEFSASFFLSLGVGFRLGSFSLSLPLAWRLPGGLGAGLCLGLRL